MRKFSNRNRISRRNLIASGICVAASPWVASEAKSLPLASEKAKNIHLSLAAYSVRQALTSGKMDLFDFIDWCAELGLPGTELTSYYFEKDFNSAYLRKLRNHAFRQGVTVSGTAIRNNFCLPPGPEKDKQVEDVKKWIDYASDLFAPHVRIFAGDVPKDATNDEGIRWVAEGVRSILDHAERRGVIIGLENHGGITAKAVDLKEICRQVGKHPWFGVNLDTGNFRDDPYEELKVVADWAVNVQVKVEVWSPDGEKVPADLARFRDIIIDSGYKGWVALEYEAPNDPFQEIPSYIDELRRLFYG
jgi:sugar phosphate isomerase/epimerase